ncbi:hypothetical protein FALBO_9476 [Fusarium albosuccineum]|uniref:Uncharacterized protein n=1 Tax=Fusarium albosuccineum TaxID=1237068 RepID=A0A8H4L8S6_9HYPO|nr:hypothetical protein FALBO_9476 [Fusarium albosuccineum]
MLLSKNGTLIKRQHKFRYRNTGPGTSYFDSLSREGLQVVAVWLNLLPNRASNPSTQRTTAFPSSHSRVDCPVWPVVIIAIGPPPDPPHLLLLASPHVDKTLPSTRPPLDKTSPRQDLPSTRPPLDKTSPQQDSPLDTLLSCLNKVRIEPLCRSSASELLGLLGVGQYHYSFDA